MGKKQELNHFKIDALKAQMKNETDPFKADMYLAMIRDEARKAGYSVEDKSEGIFFIQAPKEVKESSAIQIEAPKENVPEAKIEEKIEAVSVENVETKSEEIAPVQSEEMKTESQPELAPIENTEVKAE